MIILAIDPGSERSGYVLYSAVDRLMLARGKCSNSELIAMIREVRHGNAELEGATDFAFEMAESFGAKVWNQVFEAVLWSGRFVEAWTKTTGRSVARIYRRDVKLHLTGSPRAKDAQIRQCLLDRWGGKQAAVGTKRAPGPLYGVSADAWAALAIAVTYAEQGVRAKEAA